MSLLFVATASDPASSGAVEIGLVVSVDAVVVVVAAVVVIIAAAVLRFRGATYSAFDSMIHAAL